MRLLPLSVAALLIAAGPATAAVTPLVPLAPEDEEVPYAVAGDEVLVAPPAGRVARVLGVPAGGGAPVERLRFAPPRGREAGIFVAGSASAVAALAITDGPRALQPFGGRPGEPLSPAAPLRRFRPGRWSPFGTYVAGDRTFFGELRFSPEALRLAVHEPRPGEPATIPFPRVADAFAVQNELLALALRARGQPRDADPRRLVVRDWRTGAVLWERRIARGIDAIALHPGGRALVEDSQGGILEVAAGGAAVRTVTDEGEAPVYAGDDVVFRRLGRRDEDPDRLVLVAPDGTERPFGVPSARLGAPVADGRRVAWSVRGCVVTAPVDAPAQDAVDEGPCARTEMTFVMDESPQGVRMRRARIVLHCVAAPPPGCQGTLVVRFGRRGRVAAPRRFTVPAGQDGRFDLRLTRAAWRRVRRASRDPESGAFVEVRATTVDPTGRRSVLSDGHVLIARK